jgi:hypothetical protein
LIAALASESGSALAARGPLVLTGVGRVVSHTPVGSAFWCHTSIDGIEGDTFEGQLELVDDAGTVLLTCDRLQLKVLGDRTRDTADLMCQEVREQVTPREPPAAPSGALSPSELTGLLNPRMDRFAAEAGFGDYYELVEPTLNAMAVGAIRDALLQLGASGRSENGMARPAVGPRHRRLLERLVEIARTADLDTSRGEKDLAGRDDVGSAVRLVRESGQRLVAT